MYQMPFKNSSKYYVVLGVCIVLGLLFHKNYITEYPSFIHAWAQADHYSITLGFIENGLNFFKPQTLMYNHQFPDWWSSTTETGITSVDFPIHHYIPALIMDVLGVQSPIVNRLYLFCYSLLGLLGVYKLTFLFSKNHLRSLFVMIFAATSPVFVYYQAGFFPSIPSLSNAILGVYFYVSYLQNSKIKQFYISIALLTLAALSRTTFVIPLIAVFGNEFLRIVFKETKWKSKILPTLFSILAILGYFLYNKYLRETYSSIFIGYLLPPESLEDFLNTLYSVYIHWFFDYFSRYHYGFFVALLIGWFVFKNKSNKPPFLRWVFRFIGVFCLGLFFFLIAMSEAFKQHDYYFLDTFYLPTIILLSIGCAYFPQLKSKYIRLSISGLSVCLVVMFCISVTKNQKGRRVILDYDSATNTKISYEGSKAYLTKLGISEKAKILAIDICAPNIPFVMMDRRGHGVFNPTRDNLNKALSWDFDYVVTQNIYFEERTHKVYPELVKHLTVIGNNGRITVSKYHKEEIDQSFKQYLFEKGPEPFLVKTCDFEGEAGSNWSNVIRADSVWAGNHIGEMKLKELYGITLKEKSVKALTEKSVMLRLTAKVYLKKGLTSKFVLGLGENNVEKVNQIFPLSDYIQSDKTEEWQDIEIIKMLPVLNSDNNMLSLFLWNPKEDHFYIDDVKVELY